MKISLYWVCYQKVKQKCAYRRSQECPVQRTAAGREWGGARGRSRWSSLGSSSGPPASRSLAAQSITRAHIAHSDLIEYYVNVWSCLRIAQHNSSQQPVPSTWGWNEARPEACLSVDSCSEAMRFVYCALTRPDLNSLFNDEWSMSRLLDVKYLSPLLRVFTIALLWIDVNYNTLAGHSAQQSAAATRGSPGRSSAGGVSVRCTCRRSGCSTGT